MFVLNQSRAARPFNPIPVRARSLVFGAVVFAVPSERRPSAWLLISAISISAPSYNQPEQPVGHTGTGGHILRKEAILYFALDGGLCDG